MKCGISQCVQQNDNRFLWRCHGTCERRYHAACIGVQRNHEEMLRTFMLPLCAECQERFTPEFNLRELAISFQHITENIGHTLTANHKLLTNFKTLTATHDEALGHIEKMFDEIKENISTVTSSSKTSTTEIKNKLSALLDTPPTHSHAPTDEAAAKSAATAAAAAAAIATATTDSIQQLPHLISALKNDLVDSQAILVCDVKSHMEELARTLTKSSTQTAKFNTLAHELQSVNNVPHNPEQPTASWRLLGSKKVWKNDWTDYDAKQRLRRLQEKNEEKARRRRKQRKGRHQDTNYKDSNNNNYRNNDYNNNNINNNAKISKNSGSLDKNTNCNRSDKQLLAAAKVQFAGPPPIIDHPIAGLAVPNLINFRKGETINPYRPEKQNHDNAPENIEGLAPVHDPCNSDTGFNLDPLLPPIVRLTQQSAEGDGRILKARLRDPKIMKVVRMFLAYMKDQPSSVCIEGMTPTSIRMLLLSEGLPACPEHLLRIFNEVHQEYGVNPADTAADLQSYRQYLSSERTHRLQHLRECTTKFFSPLRQQNFRK